MPALFVQNKDQLLQVNPALDFRIYHAIKRIFNDYGERVYVKPDSLAITASHVEIGTTDTTVMGLPSGVTNEAYVSDNLITHFSSSNAGDDQSVIVKGHTLSGGNFTAVTQTITLVGQTKTALGTPLARVSEMYNDDTTDFAGDIYIYEDGAVTAGVPDTASEVHMYLPASINHNQSIKAASTTAQNEYFIITDIEGSIDNKSAASCDVELQIRLYGKVFRTIRNFTLNTAGSSVYYIPLDPCIVVPPNSDIRMRAITSSGTVDISGTISGYLTATEGS